MHETFFRKKKQRCLKDMTEKEKMEKKPKKEKINSLLLFSFPLLPDHGKRLVLLFKFLGATSYKATAKQRFNRNQNAAAF
jgi:hypothetical protein